MSAVIDFQLNDQASDEIERIFALQQLRKIELRESTYEQRLAKLQKLKDAVQAHQQQIIEAAYADFKKPEVEVLLGEVMPVVAAVNFAMKNLKKWMKPRKVKSPINMMGIDSILFPEPKGSSLIIAPWNYPVFLTFVPLVSAIAAGCTAMLKPSEMTPQISQALDDIVREIFDEEEVALFQGDASVAQKLLEQPYDHIFYTGNPEIGKVVMAAAAKHLTSVTLELGGKSPVIIDESADVRQAAERVAAGKFLNCGQTCVAPDYILVHESQQQGLINAFEEIVNENWLQHAPSVEQSDSYGRIVNNRHYQRISSLISDAKAGGAAIAVGGKENGDDNFIEPTVLKNVARDAKIMDEEIFGPVLPLVTYTDLEDALDYINAKPKPLALYVFSKLKKTADKVLHATSAGGTSVNNVMIHGMNPYLPFGGVNNSGVGKTNGYYGFLEFTNQKAVAVQKWGINPLGLFKPPYTTKMRDLINLVIRRFA